MEWKGNRKGMEKKQKLYGTKIKRNGVELERKWNGKLKIEKVNEKLNRNGMEMEWRKKRQIKWKQNLIGMEQKWNGNGMENVGEILFCKMDLEMERNGNGMEMELIISSVWN